MPQKACAFMPNLRECSTLAIQILQVQIVAERPAVLPLIPSCARIVVETMKLLLTQLKDSPAAQTICCHVAASVLGHVRDALRLLARLEGGPLELLTSLADRSLLRACLPVLLVFLLALSQFCKTGALLPTLAEVAQLLQGLSGQSPGHLTGGSPSAALSLHSSEAPFDPLTQTKLATRLVESPHRYRPGDSPIQDVQSAFIPGADFLLVQFDPRSAMGENDFVKLQKADGATIAGPLMGPAEHRWCVEPILVPGNTVTFVQEMDGGAAAVHGGDWGYKAVVTGYRAPGYSFQVRMFAFSALVLINLFLPCKESHVKGLRWMLLVLSVSLLTGSLYFNPLNLT